MLLILLFLDPSSASCAPQAKLAPEATLATVLWTLALSTVLLGLTLILTGKLQVRTGLHYTAAVLRKTCSLTQHIWVCGVSSGYPE